MTYAKVSGRRRSVSGVPVYRCGRCARSRRSARGCAAGSDDHPGGGVAAVAFQVELSFEGLVDRLDGQA